MLDTGLLIEQSRDQALIVNQVLMYQADSS